jgi:hypothetical protein
LELETSKEILKEVFPFQALGCLGHDPEEAGGEELERGELVVVKIAHIRKI